MHLDRRRDIAREAGGIFAHEKNRRLSGNAADFLMCCIDNVFGHTGRYYKIAAGLSTLDD